MATTSAAPADSEGIVLDIEGQRPHFLLRFSSAVGRFAQSSPIGMVAVGIWLLMFVMAVFAPILSPYDPLEADYGAIRAAPTAEHILGTDQLGRDLLSRIIYGARITLIVSITAVFVGDLIGFVWGIASGYLGQRFDLISQRVVDVLMSFPGLILALLLLVVLGAGLVTVIVAISVTRIPSATRITRAVVLSIKETSYVEAAKMIGASNVRIMVRHVAPQAVAPISGGGDASSGRRDFRGVGVKFSGNGDSAAGAELGQYAGRCAGCGVSSAVVAGDFSRRGDYDCDYGCQPLWRRFQGLPRPEAATAD